MIVAVYSMPAMPRSAARLLLVLLGLLLGILPIELGLRLAGPNVPLDLTMARFQVFHPVYGFFHKPGVSGWLRTDEFTSYVKFNSRGLRGPEVAIPKPADTFRVLVLGDSVVEGAQVAYEETLAARLAPTLAGVAGGRRVETVNAGVAGFGTGQELLFLEREGLAYGPDLVVLVFTIANDVADNSIEVARRAKLAVDRRPYFAVGPDGRPTPLPFEAPPPEPFEGARGFVRDRSALFTTLELWLEGKEVARAQGSAVPRLQTEREVYLRELGDDWPQGWEITEALLGRVDEVARGAGAPLVVVLSPTQWQTYDDLWSDKEFMGTSSQNERRFGPTAPNERLAAIAERRGLGLVDLLPHFRVEAEAGRLPIFRRDGHWTSLGHEVATRAVADAVRTRVLATLPPTAGR